MLEFTVSQRKLKKIRKAEVKIEQKSVNNWFNRSLGYWQILKENWKVIILILIGVTLIYANGMNADFVSDDYATILNNPRLTDLAYMGRTFNITSSFISIFGMIFGTNKLAFHLSSLVAYWVAIIIAYVLLVKLFGKIVAFFSMVIFSFHPIHVEAVTWISGKPYLFIAIFVMIAFMFFIKFIEEEKLKYLVWCCVFFVIAFLTDNPRPFSLFPLMVLYLIYSKIDIRKTKFYKYWPYVVGLLLLALAFAWPNIVARTNTVNSGYNTSESVFYNPFFQYPTGIAKYLQLLLVPIDLTLYHTMYVFPVWLNWLIILTYIGILIYSYFKDRRYFFGLSFFIVVILPSMAPVKVSWLVAERYSFLASLGFCLFIGLLLSDLFEKYKYASVAILSLITVVFSYRTILRNIDWQTNHNLWVNTCQVSPNSHNAWNNIGDDYDKLKQYDNAIKGFTQSTIVKPNYADAYHNRANIFFKTGRLDLARDSYNTALYYSPGLTQTYLSLTQIDLMEGKLDLALQHATTAYQQDPTSVQNAYVLAIVYAQSGNKQKSVELLKNILRAQPDFKLAIDALRQIEALPSST